MAKALRKIPPDELARRLREITKQTDKRFAFFLGAGCSVSSGIPDATALVRDHWLPRLRDLCAPDRQDLHEWARELISAYDANKPAAAYGSVMAKLFLQPEERQREVEELCDGRFPAFGYGVLAGVMALEGGCFNVALTTNFDDLIPDALYLYTRARPLVIHHESLASFIRPTRTRPLVVKLHGDNRLSPQNTAEETEKLKREIEKQVRSLLNDRGLIFIGYGGSDAGISRMLNTLPRDALPLGVYWVGHTVPGGAIGRWLSARDTVWVEHGDFDELMLLVLNAFELPHPDRKRFEDVFDAYTETYESLSARIILLPDTEPGAPALKEAVGRADESFPDWRAAYLSARRLETTDPDKADDMYKAALEQFPDSAVLLGGYANFLLDVRKNLDQAEEFYKRAIEVDPNHGINLSNFARFYWLQRHDNDRADELFRRAVDAGPQYAFTLASYALFLQNERKENDRAEDFYRRAIEADPKYANSLGNYALFLQNIRRDYDRAEEFYRRAIEADPNNPSSLGNYGRFLKNVRKDHDQAEAFYRRAIDADPSNAVNLGSYGLLLQVVRKKYREAEEYYRRALAVDPNLVWSLANYSGLLLARGEQDEGLSTLANLLDQQVNETSAEAAEAWFYAFAHRPAPERADALRNLKRVLLAGARSPGWDLTENITRARENGHPDSEWLEKLAAVISDGADITILDDWPAWKDA